MLRIGIITGLAMEAGILRKYAQIWENTAPFVKVSGPGIFNAYTSAQELIEKDAGALMSFGFCGGLSPELEAGTIVLADKIVQSSGESFSCDAVWRESLYALLAGTMPITHSSILSAQAIAATPRGKQDLHQRTKMAAIDMESAGVASAAHERGIPFIALRAISDPANTALPPLALTAIDEKGTLQPAAVLKSLLKHPTQISALPEMARNSKLATNALSASARLAGPGFGFY